MATYIPGIKDYIPQAQPFQPDYNFLGNMLQTKQSQYDQNYKQLSETYGTLLNSDMLREDNIEKRNEFMKMIDNDIKRISGMDLSLQQNVDSANKVFDSFFQNKDLVKDMTYTKEYQKQLQAGEIMRNCTDPKMCGGKKFWETGMQALHYKADEFKKASKAESMTMTTGRYVGQVDVQGKATEYLEKLLGKSGDGAFGIQSVSFSPDGRYQITTKNGALLSVPFQQLIQAQYGKDQDVIDMYNTQSYVNRKGFIAGNLDKFGGNEEAAEDEYFRQIDVHYQQAQIAQEQARQNANAARSKKDLFAEEIKKKGSTGKDGLANGYAGALDDMAASQEVSKYAEDTYNIAKSVFEAGENRAMRRNRADQLIGRSLMNKELSESAIRAAAMTGSVSIKEDQYKLKQFDFSLDMAKQKSMYDLMDRNNMRQGLYDLKKSIAIEDHKALLEYKKRGSQIEGGNQGSYVDGVIGTTAIEGTDESQAAKDELFQEVNNVKGAADKFSSGYANTMMGILEDPNASAAEKGVAQDVLEKMYGTVKVSADGSYKSAGYDAKRNVFVDSKGNVHETAQDMVGSIDWKKAYSTAQGFAKQYKDITSHSAYINGEGKKITDIYNQHALNLKADSEAWVNNNKNLKTWAATKLAGKDLIGFNNLFSSVNTLKDSKSYAQDFMKNNPGATLEDATDAYEEANKHYNKYYNEGNVMGRDAQGNPVPVVKSTHGSAAFGMMGGGKSAGGGVLFEFNSESPASLGSRGLTTFYDDAQSTQAIWTVGNYATKEQALEAQKVSGQYAKLAMQQLMSDLRTGNLTKAEKEIVQGQIMYMDLAIGDKDMIGATIKLPTSWLQKYQKSDKNVVWADNMTLASEGLSMYVPRATAKNAFKQSFDEQTYDHVINNMNVDVDVPGAGKVTIHKRSGDGTVTAVGDMGHYWVNPNTGKTEWQVIPVTKTYNSDAGGQNIYVNIDKALNELALANKAFEAGNKDAYVHDPNQLPQIQSQLDAMSQGMDPSQAYLQSISQELSGR